MADGEGIPRKVKNLAGSKFGRWSVISFARLVKHQSLWLCRCDCGAEKELTRGKLMSGRSLSCGCLRRAQNTKHGRVGRGDSTYQSWANMIQRCRSKTRRGHQFYVDRGISVCQLMRDFLGFLSEMGDKPTAKHSIDRIDGNGHYSCGFCQECKDNGWGKNCRWATTSEQSRNTRRNRLLSFREETMCVSDWAAKLGIAPYILHGRLNRLGWSVTKALGTPVKRRSKI